MHPNLLCDVISGGANPSDTKEDVVLEEIGGETLDGVGKCSAEHEGLSALHRHPTLLYNAADLRLEAHVQHAIGLVEDHHIDVLKRQTTTLYEVNQPTYSPPHIC